MDFLLRRGYPFQEEFNFKNEQGKLIAIPGRTCRVVLRRGDFVREYRPGAGLVKSRSSITWRIPAQETKDFDYRTLYYTLYVDDNEVTRGVVKVQDA